MKRILLGCILLLVGGCTFGTPPQGFTKTEYILVTPKATWLLDNPVAAPPDRGEFLAADCPTQLELYNRVYLKQTRALQGCNLDKASIRDWVSTEQSNPRYQPSPP